MRKAIRTGTTTKRAMAIAPPSTTAKELRFERSAPPSLVLKSVSSIYTDFFLPEECARMEQPLSAWLAPRPALRAFERRATAGGY